jgi:hypothetical protein
VLCKPHVEAIKLLLVLLVLWHTDSTLRVLGCTQPFALQPC